jgi:hypothetical protein
VGTSLSRAFSDEFRISGEVLNRGNGEPVSILETSFTTWTLIALPEGKDHRVNPEKIRGVPCTDARMGARTMMVGNVFKVPDHGYVP